MAVVVTASSQTRRRKVVSSLWLAGTGRYPTLQLPHDLARLYGLDEACQIELIMKDEGILIKRYED